MLVSYSDFPYRGVSVPYSPDRSGGVSLTDFRPFSGNPPAGPTEIRLVRDERFLCIDVICKEKIGHLRAGNTATGYNIWNGGDMIELFFGAVDPEPWLLQLAVNAGGGRFDSSGQYALWNARVKVENDCWKVKLEIPFSMLKIQNLSCGFNLCRVAEADHAISTWSPLRSAFHEFENFGELLFCDYAVAQFAKTGIFSASELSRKTFEQQMQSLRIPAETTIHGPWLSYPGEENMTVSLVTAGRCGAFIELREKGEQPWRRFPCSRQNAVLEQDQFFHSASLEGLKAGREYEYRTVVLCPLERNERISPVYSFRTFSTNQKKFSAVIVSDIHSNAGLLQQFLASDEAKKADFLVNLGDYLSCTCGPESIFDGFLAAECEDFAREKPLVFVRGNHEQVGMFSGLYPRLLGHPSGKSYSAFVCGDIGFLLLDAGNDKPDDNRGIRCNSAMIEEENQWLRQQVRQPRPSPVRRWIALLHMPPKNRDAYDSHAALKVLDGFTPDLLLSGHDHHYFVIEPGSGIRNMKRSGQRMDDAPVLPYPIIANDVDTMIVLEADGGHISLRILTADGTLLDSFELPEPFSQPPRQENMI